MKYMSTHPALEWTIPFDHPAFAGHFPGTPILPGVLLVDTALHTIAAATGIALDTCTLSSVKFLSPARPGDTLAIDYELAQSGTLHFAVMAGVEGSPARRTIASGSVVPDLPRCQPRCQPR